MFQDMMDRIEDETIKFLYFMRIEAGAPPMPYPEDEEERRGRSETHGSAMASPNGKAPHPELPPKQKRKSAKRKNRWSI